ncbi:MAG: hypothetical protein M3020_13455 [Myxococcota bacterium]|nr:hypothetical protein [Myxococcota bacterium]
MRFTAACVWALFLPAACSSDGVPKTDSGQTGSVGSSPNECRAAGDCEQRVRGELATFTAPVAGRGDIESTECVNASLSSGHRGPSCVCYLSGGGARALGPAGVDCFVYGRGGDCLAPGPDFAGCDVNDPTSCDEACAELEPALEADAARTFEASSFYQACENQLCQTVIELDGRCFPEQSYQSGRSYDCALGAEAILAAEREARQAPNHEALPETRSPYVAGTDGFVKLVVVQSYVGPEASPPSFGVGAQFAEIAPGEKASFGTILDPLEGVDDCGVFQGGGAGSALQSRSTRRPRSVFWTPASGGRSSVASRPTSSSRRMGSSSISRARRHATGSATACTWRAAGSGRGSIRRTGCACPRR